MSDVQFSMPGTRALVTGGSSGLGPTIVRALDNAGARVAIQYHANSEGASRLSSLLTTPAPVIQADLSHPHDVTRLFDTAASALDGINLLVNCAAAESQLVSPLRDLDLPRWQATQQTNVDAPMQLIQAFARAGTPGTIINISSIEASRPAPGHSHYSVSKAALEMLTRAAALELGPLGIRVNAIAPVLIWRDGIDEAWPEGYKAWCEAAPLGHLVQPAHIADAVLFLASDAGASMTGTVLTIDCGMSVSPSW